MAFCNEDRFVPVGDVTMRELFASITSADCVYLVDDIWTKNFGPYAQNMYNKLIHPVDWSDFYHQIGDLLIDWSVEYSHGDYAANRRAQWDANVGLQRVHGNQVEEHVREVNEYFRRTGQDLQITASRLDGRPIETAPPLPPRNPRPPAELNYAELNHNDVGEGSRPNPPPRQDSGYAKINFKLLDAKRDRRSLSSESFTAGMTKYVWDGETHVMKLINHPFIVSVSIWPGATECAAPQRYALYTSLGDACNEYCASRDSERVTLSPLDETIFKPRLPTPSPDCDMFDRVCELEKEFGGRQAILPFETRKRDSDSAHVLVEGYTEVYDDADNEIKY